MYYKNNEGYNDPTAGCVIKKLEEEERQKISNANGCLINSFRRLANESGFEIVGRITLRHKETGRIFE